MGEFPRRPTLSFNTSFKSWDTLPPLLEKNTLNRSPAISDNFLKSSSSFFLSFSSFYFQTAHLIIFSHFPGPHAPSFSAFGFDPCRFSYYYSWSWAAVVFFPSEFCLFCCVVHTNRSNGGRVKWKGCGPGPFSACLSAAWVNRTVRSAQRERGGGGRICIHGVVEGFPLSGPLTCLKKERQHLKWVHPSIRTVCSGNWQVLLLKDSVITSWPLFL